MEPADPEVERCVPHRAPILRVSRLLAGNATRATVLGTEPVGDGALPWAMGAIEGLAQSAALLLGRTHRDATGTRDGGGSRGMLVAIKRFAIHAEPPPGAAITYSIELVRRFGPTTLLRGHAEHDGRRLAEGELTLWAPAPE